MRPRSSLLLVVGALLGSLLLSGCWTLSLHPFYSNDTLTFDERLLGAWGEKNDTVTFTQSGPKEYKIRLIEKGQTSLLNARLIKLGEQVYLDVSPTGEDDVDVADHHRISGHSIWKVSWKGDALLLTPMDFSWLRNLLEQEPKAISSVHIDKDFILLTASTEELQ